MPIAPAADSSRWRVRSPFSVPETVRRLETAIRLHPDIRLLARVDQAETVAAAGGSVRPIIELLFENVRFVRRLVEIDPEAAFNLPIKALIWQECRTAGVQVRLPSTDPQSLVPEPPGVSAVIADIEKILRRMIERTIDPADSPST